MRRVGVLLARLVPHRRTVARVLCVLAAALLARQAVWAGFTVPQCAYLVALAVVFVQQWRWAEWARVEHELAG